MFLSLDTDDSEQPSPWQQTLPSQSSVALGRSYSVEDGGGRSLPIRVEARTQPPAYSTPPSRSYSADSPRSNQQQPRDFVSNQKDLPREIPIVFEGLQEGLRNLNQAVHDEPWGLDTPRTHSFERESRKPTRLQEVPIQRESPKSQKSLPQSPERQPGLVSYAGRQIPIEVRQASIGGRSYGLQQPKIEQEIQIDTDEDKKKADLERRRKELERDIDNVIFEAIKQVPVYNQKSESDLRSPKPLERKPFSKQASIEDEIIMPQKIESPQKQRVAEALNKAQGSNQAAIESQFDLEKAKQDWEQRKKDWEMRNQVGSYSTLPVKKSAAGKQYTPKPSSGFESDTGGYTTLPSFKNKGRNKFTHSISNDPDSGSFSDIEGGRGRSQPSWRPVNSPVKPKQPWLKASNMTNPEYAWTPSASPGLKKKEFRPIEVIHTKQDQRDVNSQYDNQGIHNEDFHKRDDIDERFPRGFIPVKIQHEPRPRKGKLYEKYQA